MLRESGGLLLDDVEGVFRFVPRMVRLCSEEGGFFSEDVFFCILGVQVGGARDELARADVSSFFQPIEVFTSLC